MRRALPILVLLAAASGLDAQLRLDRPPNLLGTWVPARGVVQFNFIHRFYVTPGPARAVINYPTFALAVGLPADIAVGTYYSTRGVAATFTNELELFARWRAVSEGPLTVSVSPAFNSAARSVDAEIAADWTRGPVTVSGALRGMSRAYDTDEARAAAALGGVVRLNDYVALGGDIASLLDAAAGEDPAWSIGFLLVIPGSPHTFSLHASNVAVNTIQGASREQLLPSSKPLYGFEFTIPLHLGRFAPWFGGGGGRGTAAATPGAGAAAAAQVAIESFVFRVDTVVIAAGQVVRWTNRDVVAHAVTLDDGSADSGLIEPGAAYERRFERPGTYGYHCTPHPFMRGVVVVR